MSFTEIANRRRLRTVSGHLDGLTWDVEADASQRLRVPTTAAIDPLLRLLPRRGLDPSIMHVVLERLEPSPIERALVAWDVAADTLLGDEDAEFEERLRLHLAPLRALGASPSAAIPRDRVTSLIEAVGSSDATLGGTFPSLAAVVALRAGDAGLEVALEFVDRLALAHLPSLALAYLQIMWARHELPSALDRLIEIGLDFERFDSIPVVTGREPRFLERQAYFAMRVALAQLELGVAAEVLDEARTRGAATSDPSLQLAAIELDVLSARPLEYGLADRVEALAPEQAKWRYRSRVGAEVRFEQQPADASIWVELFQSSFGNDLRVWAQAGAKQESHPTLRVLASREVRHQSYDPTSWRALAPFVDDFGPIELELQRRATTQLTNALR